MMSDEWRMKITLWKFVIRHSKFVISGGTSRNHVGSLGAMPGTGTRIIARSGQAI
jgi:hypothetical protein